MYALKNKVPLIGNPNQPAITSTNEKAKQWTVFKLPSNAHYRTPTGAKAVETIGIIL